MPEGQPENQNSDVFRDFKYDITPDHIDEFRTKLLTGGIDGEFHPSDLKRVRENDGFCRRYLRHKRVNVENAVEMAKTSLKWRKEFGVNEITLDSLPAEYFNLGGLFPFGMDKFGSYIIILRVKNHRKNPKMVDQMKRYMVFWVERILYELNGARISFIFDCGEAGISNLDLDIVQFLILILKEYYPWALGYIIIYDMPWLLNAAWRLVKTWLPEESMERIKFATKENIQEYVDADQLPPHMGGSKSLPFETYTSNELDVLLESIGGKTPTIRRTHTIEAYYRQYNLFTTDDEFPEDFFIRCSPSKELVFPPRNIEGAASAVLTLTNVSKHAVAYKVKTTSLETFRVKPFFGIISANQSVHVTVQQTKEYQGGKLLVQAAEINNADILPHELIELWKLLKKSQIKEHKLRCRVSHDKELYDSINNLICDESDAFMNYNDGNTTVSQQQLLSGLQGTARELLNKMSEIEAKSERISKRQNYMSVFLFLTMALVFVNIAIFVMEKPCS